MRVSSAITRVAVNAHDGYVRSWISRARLERTAVADQRNYLRRGLALNTPDSMDSEGPRGAWSLSTFHNT